MELTRNLNILCTLPIPDMHLAQIVRFTPHSLRSTMKRSINPLEAVDILKQNIGSLCLVFDIGGTALKYLVASIDKDGVIVTDETKQIMVVNEGGGENYVQVLRTVADKFRGLPVAISTAGIVEDNALIESPNLPIFVDKLRSINGFIGIFGYPIPVMNDAEAGAIAGAVGVASRDERVKPIIYIINGGGIGGAIMSSDGIIYAMEPGHIELIDELNPKHVSTPCGVQGSTHVCLERVGASGAGIETQWFQLTGQSLTGKEIAERMYMGNSLALDLYNTAGTITAHAIEGIRHATSDMSVEDISVVLHGGLFKTHGMAERIQSILQKYHNKNIDIILASKLGYSNACMAGLAIAAFTMM